MSEATKVPSAGPKWMIWLGRVLSALPVGLLLFSGVMKLMGPPEMAANFEHLGWPPDLAVTLGILEISCVVVYLVPPTAVFGAILLTGYLGGAVATHVRIGEPWIMVVLVGVLLWVGLVLRDSRLRALLFGRR